MARAAVIVDNIIDNMIEIGSLEPNYGMQLAWADPPVDMGWIFLGMDPDKEGYGLFEPPEPIDPPAEG